MADGIRRRRLLARAGVLGAAVIAGCSSGGDSSDDGSSAESGDGTDDDNSGDTEDTGPSDSGDSSDPGTDSEPSDEELLAETHAVTEIESVFQQLDQESVTLNLQPADENADYAQSDIFNRYVGELDVQLDLLDARRSRHINNKAAEHGMVREFVGIIENRDEQALEQLHQEYLEAAGGENLNGYPETIDWEILVDESRSFAERWTESGARDILYKIEVLRMNGISSTNNQYTMQAIQNAERANGFPTFVWDIQADGHGLGAAITLPKETYEGNLSDQEAWVVQTDPDEEQMQTWNESAYSNGGGDERHPADPSYEDSNESFYEATGLGKDEVNLKERISIADRSIIEEFHEFYRSTEQEALYGHVDPITVAGYVIESNLDGRSDSNIEIELGQEQMELRYSS